jgi:predicted NUDIX family NTP pyrophosphohydrolase
MPKRSAGILPYRRRDGGCEVFLVHPGGPFWARKDLGAWSIAKGEYQVPEPALQAAVREFEEETGHRLPGPFRPLSAVRLASGKVIDAWCTEADWDLATFKSNTFELEYPKGSGVTKTYPEVDRVAWFDVDTAQRKIHAGQLPLLHELKRLLG